ncbi:hypothetical protein FM104_13180 [Microbacterium esteraromaticum]|uniref:S1 motif domain-containing protein n=1 Tax=Microbacterium esteraromaticum TaxID=57043 RepID=A0A1R4KIG3_9MICO|nr:hypothetical protein [Microbacterium esteraromaticum]SJN44110.1 hypothetical protein FM104_13180 [Microbacterium esteraromaticum]
MRHVDTIDEATAIAAEILGPRKKPLVLISTDAQGKFLFDPSHVEREAGSDADVVTIAHGLVTFALEDALPEKTSVHSGAARSYPVDFGTDPDWQRSILRFPDRHTSDDLIEDALAQVTFFPSPQPVSRREWVRAIVERVSGGTGNIAKLDNGELVSVVADHLPPSVSLSDALAVGEPVEGWLLDRDLAPEVSEVDYSRFADGAVTLARVVKVTPARTKLVLHPSDTSGIDLRRRDVIPGIDDGENADVQVSDIVRVGQTVRARVTRSGRSLGLSLVGVDPEVALVPPLSLLSGGSPWLREGVDGVADPALTRVPATPAESMPAPPAGYTIDVPASPVSTLAAGSPSTLHDHPSPTAALNDIRDELSGLRGAFARLSRELRAGTDLETIDRLRDEVAGLTSALHQERDVRRERDTIIAGLRVELREARAQRATPTESRRTDRASWPSGDAWLRFEVLSTWAGRSTAPDKTNHPLREYTIGTDFVPSLTPLDAGQLEKALRAIVDVVTGRASEITGRQLHRLRTGEAGNSPYVSRADGATCWRASIEINVASARRLHYWQHPNGSIELSRVVLHDDFQP